MVPVYLRHAKLLEKNETTKETGEKVHLFHLFPFFSRLQPAS
jgi:hypothetical protein